MNIESGKLDRVVVAAPFGAPLLGDERKIEDRVSQTAEKSLGFFAKAWRAICAFFASLIPSFRAEKGGVNPETETKVAAVIEKSCLPSITSTFERAKEALKGYVIGLMQEQEARTPSFEEARYRLEKKSGALLTNQQARGQQVVAEELSLAQKERFRDAKEALEGFGKQLLKGQSKRGHAYIKAEIKKAEKKLKNALRREAAQHVYTTVEEMQARYQSALKKVPHLERLQLFTKSQIALYKIQLQYLDEIAPSAQAARAAELTKESVQTFAHRASTFFKTGKVEPTATKTKGPNPDEKRDAALKALGKQTRKQIRELGIEDGQVFIEKLAQLAYSLRTMSGKTPFGDIKTRTKASIEQQQARTERRYTARQKELAAAQGDLAFGKFSAKDSRGNLDLPLSVQSSFGKLRSELKKLKAGDKKLAQHLKTKIITDITLPSPEKRRVINKLITDQFAAQVTLEHLKK